MSGFGLAPPRRPAPPLAGPGREELVTALRAEIEAVGPVTFARFMQRALYEPAVGYYAGAHARATRDGDFLTAPELHPIFGYALARQVDEIWRALGEPEPFVVREYGAGSGALAETLLDGLRRLGSPSLSRLRYQPIEVGDRGAAVGRRLEAAGFAGVVEPTDNDNRFIGCVLANEFLDALPVHRVVRRGAELRELYVGWREDGFVEVEDRLSTPALATWFSERGIELADGQAAEVNLAMSAWTAELARDLGRGYVVVMDYGVEPAALYHPARTSGTIRAFRGQHVGGDPLTGVGEQDLTAHVDLDALRRSAAANGLDVLGTTSQAEFLLGCGLEEVVAAEAAALPEEWAPRLLLRSATARLLDPRQLGGYAVVVLGRGVPAAPALRGLSVSLPRRG